MHARVAGLNGTSGCTDEGRVRVSESVHDDIVDRLVGVMVSGRRVALHVVLQQLVEVCRQV